MFKRKKSKSIFKLTRKQKRQVSETSSIERAKRANSKKYAEFVKSGGALSGVYDISDKNTAAFVKKYGEFIPKKEIYKRDKNGSLVPVYRGRQ